MAWQVIEKLMSISTDYWITFINISDDMDCPGDHYTPKTPETRPGEPLKKLLPANDCLVSFLAINRQPYLRSSCINARILFVHLILCSYNNNNSMLLPAHLCLVTLLSS